MILFYFNKSILLLGHLFTQILSYMGHFEHLEKLQLIWVGCFHLFADTFTSAPEH